MCILLVKELESVLLCARVNIVSGDNYPTVPLVTDNIFGYVGKYCGGDKILSPPWFQHCGGERPRRSDASAPRQTLRHHYTLNCVVTWLRL